MYVSISVAALILGTLSEPVHADEAGVSYWLPGRFGSLAAVPAVAGWSMAEVYYHTTLAASVLDLADGTEQHRGAGW